MSIKITTGTTTVEYAVVDFEHGHYNFGAAYTHIGLHHDTVTIYDVSDLHSEIRVLIEKAKRFHAKSTVSMNIEGKKRRIIETGNVDAYSKKMNEFSKQFNRLVADITVKYDGQIEETKKNIGHHWDTVNRKFVPSLGDFSKAFFFKVSIG